MHRQAIGGDSQSYMTGIKPDRYELQSQIIEQKKLCTPMTSFNLGIRCGILLTVSRVWKKHGGYIVLVVLVLRQQM